MSKDYFSALDPVIKSYPDIERFEGRSGIAFRADLFGDLPGEYLKADVIYAEIPWKDGFTIFNERAQKNFDMRYEDLLSRVKAWVDALNKPTIILCGKLALRHLQPKEISFTKIRGANALACLWNYPTWEGIKISDEIMRDLSQSFNTVGDFCCGYGRTGRAFVRANKRYILSDYNGECIGYIAQNESQWYENIS
jgi:hypothetical protein